MLWLRRGRRSRIELALRGGFENLGNQSDREEGGAYTCHGIPVQPVLDAAGARGHLCCAQVVGEGTGVVLLGLVVGRVPVLA